LRKISDLHDAVVFDSNVGGVPGPTGTIDDPAALNQKIELR
jgi:hypothetical protein